MKKFNLVATLCLASYANAQDTYIDPATTAALVLYSENLKTEQEKTIEQHDKLQKAQTWVGTQMAAANDIQNKILKGLREVSGTLQNGIQVKEIYSDIKDCGTYASQISTLVEDDPEYAIFGVKATKETYESVLEMTTDVTELLKSGDLNLATSGDRYRLLFSISEKVKKLKIWLLTIMMNLERAKRLGFLRALNPFQGYINTDKTIVENIMVKYKHNF